MVDSNSKPESKTIQGSCLCGAVKYEATGTPVLECLCFCNDCRKRTGSLAMANSWYPKDNFCILEGASHLRTHNDPAGSGGTIERKFCGICASTISGKNEKKFPGVTMVSVGTMDIDLNNGEWAPKTEFFCKRKPDWMDVKADTKEFREGV